MSDLKRLFVCLHEYRRDLILGMVLVLVETFFELVIPVLMADLIDVGVANRDVHYILVKGGQMGVCAVLALVAGLMYARFAARAACGWGANIREAEFRRVQSYAFSNLDHFETSGLVTRMTTDVTVIQNAMSGGLRPLVRSPLMLVMGIGLSVMMNARLALVFIVCAPVLALIMFFIVRSVAPRYSVLQRAVDKLNAVVQENLTAIRAVKAFVRGEYEEEKFSSANGALMETSAGTFRRAVLNLPALQLAMYCSVVGIMWFGGNMIISSQLKVGELTGFLSYVLQVMNSLMLISNVFLMLTRSLASARRIGEVLEEAPALSSPDGAVTEVEDGSVDFEGVSFKYRADAAEYALSGVDLHIRAGETVGILGGTGSAKSTLVNLISRLYDVTEGSVRVGGRDVREYDIEALRSNVAVVLQKNQLFSGTIKENLRWGNKDATDEELVHVCKLAQADDFIRSFPDGYDTYIEQGGTNVSGGQKQRLCIARALLKKPKILILDDSTSAVDTKTDAGIRRALREFMPETTKIIIAQRTASVEDADRIVVMDGGSIMAVGSHAELMASNEVYREIYTSQNKAGADE